MSLTSRQRAKLERYAPAFGTRLCFSAFAEEDKRLLLLFCRDCKEERVYSTARIWYALAKGATLQCPCETDRTKIPEGFYFLRRTNEYRLLQCIECDAQYHRELRTDYFKCYCQIRTKRGELEVYDRLVENFEHVSREEHYPGSRHKADLKVIVDGISFYIEVDGSSHGSTVQRNKDREQEASFSQNRSDNDFLIRICERSKKVDHYWTQRVVDCIDLILRELDNPDEDEEIATIRYL